MFLMRLIRLLHCQAEAEMKEAPLNAPWAQLWNAYLPAYNDFVFYCNGRRDTSSL